MWFKERHQRILALLRSSQQVSANDLADVLKVSRETVRRDLLELEQEGLVNRVHGGAVLPEEEAEAPFEKRKSANIRAKQDIARKAAELITPGSSLFVDAGTTTSAFGQLLTKFSGLMVVTNSIEIAQTIKSSGTDIELILLGGQITTDVPATYGELTLSDIKRFVTDYAFVSPVAVDARYGAFSYHLREAEVARTMIEHARQSVLLCDRTKLGNTSRVRICEMDAVGRLITDSRAEAAQLTQFQEIGVNIVH